MDSDGRTGNAAFTTTHWSVVLAAGHTDIPQAADALERLCRTYWYPLYAYVRHRGHSEHDARDLTQAFFLHLFERHALSRVAPDKGRFRSFLLASLNYFLADQRDRALAQKRGGDRQFVFIDAQDAEERYRFEPIDERNPEKIFERRWALTVLAEVLARLERDYAAAGKQSLFNNLQVFLSGAMAGETYAAMASRLGITEGAIKMSVLRLRQRYRELFRETIAHTVADPAEVEDELRHLIAVITG